mgnify:CR=1 FL=1
MRIERSTISFGAKPFRRTLEVSNPHLDFVWVYTRRLSSCKDWQGIKQFGVVQTERTVSGKTTTAQRYYIGSKILTAEKMLLATRTHWQAENNLHWMLVIPKGFQVAPRRQVSEAPLSPRMECMLNNVRNVVSISPRMECMLNNVRNVVSSSLRSSR